MASRRTPNEGRCLFLPKPERRQGHKGTCRPTHLAAEWIESSDATLVAEFTETETDAKTRPAFGYARHKAKAENAILLIATTKAIGPRGRFDSVIFDAGPRLVKLEDPEEMTMREWAESELLVVYLRRQYGDSEVAELSLDKQRDGVALIVVPDMHTVLGEFIEIEKANIVQPDERPRLSTALALCRERQARLIVGTTDAIGDGRSFELPFMDIPFEVAYRTADQWDKIIDVPNPVGTAVIGLHVGNHWVRNRRPLYLFNRTGSDLFDITISKAGWTFAYGDLVHMTPSTRRVDRIVDGTSRLAGDYDVFMDCDFTISWRVTGRDERGYTWVGSVTVDRKPSTCRLIALQEWRAMSFSDQ